MTNGRVEVITSVQRRRRWSASEKQQLVAASLEPGASVSALAREAGIHASQLYGWRRQLRAQSPMSFAPVRIGRMRRLPVSSVPERSRSSLRAERGCELRAQRMVGTTRKGDRSEPVAMLLDLRGIGPEAAEVLWSEGQLRRFDNRRQLAAYAGLAPTPWQSGSVEHEQRVSKAGNPRLRTMMLQVAWLWLRHQPDSALARWFENLPFMSAVPPKRL